MAQFRQLIEIGKFHKNPHDKLVSKTYGSARRYLRKLGFEVESNNAKQELYIHPDGSYARVKNIQEV